MAMHHIHTQAVYVADWSSCCCSVVRNIGLIGILKMRLISLHNKNKNNNNNEICYLLDLVVFEDICKTSRLFGKKLSEAVL